MLAFFLYKRKKARWITLFNKIDSIVEKPVNYDQDYLNRSIAQATTDEAINIKEDLVMKAIPSSMKRLVIYRIMAVFAVLFCIFVIVTEATIIGGKYISKSFPYIVI